MRLPEIARGKVGLGHELAQKLAQIITTGFYECASLVAI
jgi:hypothetical protein